MVPGQYTFDPAHILRGGGLAVVHVAVVAHTGWGRGGVDPTRATHVHRSMTATSSCR